MRRRGNLPAAHAPSGRQRRRACAVGARSGVCCRRRRGVSPERSSERSSDRGARLVVADMSPPPRASPAPRLLSRPLLQLLLLLLLGAAPGPRRAAAFYLPGLAPVNFCEEDKKTDECKVRGPGSDRGRSLDSSGLRVRGPPPAPAATAAAARDSVSPACTKGGAAPVHGVARVASSPPHAPRS